MHFSFLSRFSPRRTLAKNREKQHSVNLLLGSSLHERVPTDHGRRASWGRGLRSETGQGGARRRAKVRCSVRPVLPFGWPPAARQAGRTGSALHRGEEGESGRPAVGQSRALAPGVPSLLGGVLRERCWGRSSCQPSPEQGGRTKKLASGKDTGGRNGFRFKKLPRGWEGGHEGV